MHTYAPGIYDFEIMSKGTQAALQALWDSCETRPAILINVVRGDGGLGHRYADAKIVSKPSTPGEYPDEIKLSEAIKVYDPDLLMRAHFAVCSDPVVQDFAFIFRRCVDTVSTKDGPAQLLLMPGCARFYNVCIEDIATQDVDRCLIDDPWHLSNLGIYAAGSTKTAHDKVAALRKVMRTQELWGSLDHFVNSLEHTAVQITEPQIHPDRLGYYEDA